MPAASRGSAGGQLDRILKILPFAARDDGASVSELAETLGVSAERVLRDVEQVVERAYYLPPEQANDTQILIEGDRVTVLARACAFRRPPRLSSREALALGVGLRALALDAPPERRDRLFALAERLERELALRPASGTEPHVALAFGPPERSEVHACLRAASRERRAVSIQYLKTGATAPERRTLHPYALVFAERWWYALAHCCMQGEIRRFRLDRVLVAEMLDEGFELPASFDAHAHVHEGRAFVADEPTEVRVRYSSRIARWIREREPGVESLSDGGVIVSHVVADPRWIVTHVLQYGSEAEVLEPEEVREMVAASAQRMLAPPPRRAARKRK
jgi:predicted DNA-binding transcriptional regulator YafY